MTDFPGTGTAAVWAGLRRPLDHPPAVDALLGISLTSARQLVGVALATSEEADRLLDSLPHVVRSLAVSTSVTATRCVGEVRGAVLWSETLAARSASPGAADVYICASAAKAFDTAENQVLVRALLTVRDAAAHAEHVDAAGHDNPGVRHARINLTRAIRFLDHRTLVGVGRTKVDGRRVRRARAGTRRNTYEPAVALLERAAEPITVDHLLPLRDERTAAQHDVLAALADGLSLPRWMTKDENLVAGPVQYIHPRGRNEDSGRHGIVVGSLLIDVPGDGDDLAARAGGAPHFLVSSAGDIPAAVELAAQYVT